MDFLQEVINIFAENTKEIYVIGSTMKLNLSKLGYGEPSRHPPKDINLLVRVKNLNKAIEQFKAWDSNPRLHIGFNDEIHLKDVTHLKVYPTIKVNLVNKSKTKSLETLLHLLKPKNPYTAILQLWVLRRQIKKCST